jgi:two-component system, OmpR family, sensor kinase
VPLTSTQRAFVEDVSDALRDPLTICRGHLELLGGDLEDQQRTIGLVLDELDRMGKMVDQLQILAEADRPDFVQRESTDLELFAHDLLAKASALASRRWALDHTAEGTLAADPHRLAEAVMNLAHNAVQHTRPDQTVALGVSLSENEARIWVRDTGVGIAMSDQARIFGRFIRGKDAHRRYRATGLGLAVVKSIAEAHGGRLEVESRAGEGSTFTLVLPRDPSQVLAPAKLLITEFSKTPNS